MKIRRRINTAGSWADIEPSRGHHPQGLVIGVHRKQLELPADSADSRGMAGNRLQFLTENDWVLIQAKAARRTFKLGEEIIRQGDWGENLYVIR